jgi:plastocyanin
MHPALSNARVRRASKLAAATALGLILAACSSNGGSSNAASGSSASGGTTVKLASLQFSPTTLTVKAGTTVTFQNTDQVQHTVTNGKDGQPASNAAFDKDLAIGSSVQVTFASAGTFNVTCKIHPTANMTVTVQ